LGEKIRVEFDGGWGVWWHAPQKILKFWAL